MRSGGGGGGVGILKPKLYFYASRIHGCNGEGSLYPRSGVESGAAWGKRAQLVFLSRPAELPVPPNDHHHAGAPAATGSSTDAHGKAKHDHLAAEGTDMPMSTTAAAIVGTGKFV
uniref:Uncharacterized protein n=1 Tax=Panagrellus redivivus TaxID=6233 RepID=A0A7E4V791_PANRE